MVIGISGLAGSGKDAFASHLIHKHNFKLYKLAGPLKQATISLFPWTMETLEDPDSKDSVDPRFGVSPREVMRYLGHEFLEDLGKRYPAFKEKVGYSLYANALDTYLGSRFCPENVIITDVRFPIEVGIIQRYNGVVLRMVRPGQKMPDNGSHSSESNSGSLPVNKEIFNVGTLPELYQKAEELYQNLFA